MDNDLGGHGEDGWPDWSFEYMRMEAGKRRNGVLTLP
jgi:hypothetical protein